MAAGISGAEKRRGGRAALAGRSLSEKARARPPGPATGAHPGNWDEAPRAPADPTPSRSRSIFERISGAPNARSRGIQDTIPSYGPLENRNIRESNLEMVNPVTLNADGILRSAD